MKEQKTKKSDIMKEALRFELKGIVFEKRNPEERTFLPLKYFQRQMASKITFTSGFAFCAGISILILIFVVFRFVQSPLWLGVWALILGALSFALSCMLSALYIFTVSLLAIREQERESISCTDDKNGK